MQLLNETSKRIQYPCTAKVDPMLCAMSKADYLKKYLGGSEGLNKEKRRKKVKKRANLAIHDDDIDWRSLIPRDQPETEEEDEPDEAPQVADYKDDSMSKVVKWQPVQSRSSGPMVEDNDLSPVRQARRRRMDSPDLTPPRGRRYDSDNDLSPPRRKKHTSDYGVRGPSRRSRGRHSSPQLIERGKPSQKLNPPKKVDNSPPRRNRHDSPDVSPPRRKRHDSVDNSPPRRINDNLSTPRVSDIAQHSPDLSPQRMGSKKTEKKTDRMSSGARAGLQNAQLLKEENATVRKRQEDFFKGLDPSVSGRNAETVYRDKQGKKVDPKLEKLKQREAERAKEEENEKFMTWGKGCVQSICSVLYIYNYLLPLKSTLQLL